VERISISNTATKVTISGPYAYVVNSPKGVDFFDITDPALPYLAGTWYQESSAHDVAAGDGYLYFGDGYDGLRIIDVTNPHVPFEVGAIEGYPGATAMALAGGYAYTANGYDGIRIIDVSDPTAPFVAGFSNQRGEANRLTVSGDLVFVVGRLTGLQIYRVDLPLSDVPALQPDPFFLYSSPNPFNPQTTIAYTVPARGAVTLQVFDLSGRLVRVLLDEETVAPGRHETVWNGRDDTGRRTASGTYFCRLEVGEYSETKKMALIK
jgi:hypothetical protein